MADDDSPQPDGNLTERVDSLEGKLDKILGILGKRDEPEQEVTRGDPPAPVITPEMMEDAVRKVHAERDAAEAAKPAPEPEKTPAEVGLPARARLARVLYGKD